MTRHREQTYEKRVDYVAKDEEAQTATGVVMVPNTVDHHGDWERPSTIEAFAEQFDAFMEVAEADGGIMHAVWPSEWMDLERNEVLDEAEDIGGRTVDAGSWVQTWGYNDDDLWDLVEDDVLGGHSIGAVDVTWDYNGDDPDDLPDEVAVPDDVDVEEFYELTDGIVQEVSAVDIPAVPDAQILTASKAVAATAEKRLADHLGNRSGFIEEAVEQRGHSEADAERLWGVLDRAVNVDGAGEPGATGKLANAATTVLSALTGSDDGNGSEAPDAQTAKDAAGGETPADDGGTDAADDMTETNDEPPEWAQTILEQTKENSERLDDLQNEADDDPLEDAPEWAQEVVAQTKANAERIDAISKQAGTTASQQLTGAEKGGDGGGDGLSRRQEFFIPQSKKHEARARAGGGR